MKVLIISQDSRRSTGTGVYFTRLIPELQTHCGDLRVILLPNKGAVWKTLKNSIRSFQPDVVHVLSCRPRYLLFLALLARQARIVITIHNLLPEEGRIGFAYSNARLYFLIRNLRFLATAVFSRIVLRFGTFSGFVCDSEQIASRVRRWTGKTVPVVQIPLSFSHYDADYPQTCDLPNFTDGGHPLRCPVILTVGAFIYHKGIHDILEALLLLKKRNTSYSYVIAGTVRDKSYFHWIQREVAIRDLQGNVLLLPNARRDQVIQAYNQTHIYVQPSYEEGFCITFLDAARIVPYLLGTPVGAIPEIAQILRHRARLIPVRDPFALSEELQRAIEAQVWKAPVTQLDVTALEQRYSWENTARLTAAFYRSRCNGDSGHSRVRDLTTLSELNS